MNHSIKKVFQHYLSQLEAIVAKVPPETFASSLADDMFNLEMNAKIAANFILRGYCPLIKREVVSFIREESGKAAVQAQITETISYLKGLPEAQQPDATRRLRDKAGFSEVDLSEPEFIYHYIIPNFLFHVSMVYAIARANGVKLSKGDYDGFHSYPTGFTFV
ncbi:DUF1993 domain-containing protein [Marinimicrobium sp. C6131]|uniref:DUF1993 family protein n=1 Tax=Marinimicrobium sp. C6131 TaxID=3022676 RepID=UPI00223E3C2A|nr:DUF1993 family protein [Marinimicrobium sp. C6131]UZJ43210.1 DUF1993 domain-containing protein [Marinimicrobium sp. C6131]